MYRIAKTIFLSRAVAPLLASVGVALLGGAPVSAVDIPQATLNGIYYPTGAQDFFEEGRRRFEREVQILIQGRLYSPKTLLQVSEEVRSQQDILRLENFKIKPGDYRDRSKQSNYSSHLR